MLNLEAAFPTHDHHNLHPPSTTPSTHTHSSPFRTMDAYNQTEQNKNPWAYLANTISRGRTKVFEAHQEGLFPRVRKLEIKFLKYLIPCNTLPELPRN